MFVKKWRLRISFLLITFLVISTIHSYYSYLFTPKVHLEKVIKNPVDVIIVPGVPIDTAGWSLFLKYRMIWAHYLLSNRIAHNVIFSGNAVHTAYNEAITMRNYAIELGIDSSRIYIEPLAKHSSENLFYGIKLANRLGFKTIGLATDPFQCDFVDDFIDEYNLDVQLMPIVWEKVNNSTIKCPSIDYNKSFVTNFTPLKEKESFFTRLSGTNGEQVNWEELN